MPKVQRIMAEFQKEHAKIQAELDERRNEIIGDFAFDKAQEKLWDEFNNALKNMKKKDWAIVVGGISKKLFNILKYVNYFKTAYTTGKFIVFFTEQVIALNKELIPLKDEILEYSNDIQNIEANQVKDLNIQLKKRGVNVARQKSHHLNEQT